MIVFVLFLWANLSLSSLLPFRRLQRSLKKYVLFKNHRIVPSMTQFFCFMKNSSVEDIFKIFYLFRQTQDAKNPYLVHIYGYSSAMLHAYMISFIIIILLKKKNIIFSFFCSNDEFRVFFVARRHITIKWNKFAW